MSRDVPRHPRVGPRSYITTNMLADIWPRIDVFLDIPTAVELYSCNKIPLIKVLMAMYSSTRVLEYYSSTIRVLVLL